MCCQQCVYCVAEILLKYCVSFQSVIAIIFLHLSFKKVYVVCSFIRIICEGIKEILNLEGEISLPYMNKLVIDSYSSMLMSMFGFTYYLHKHGCHVCKI